jgi:hypothetical protein
MGAFHDPAFADLDGAGDALLRDLAGQVVFGEHVAAGFVVVARVQVHHRVVR